MNFRLILSESNGSGVWGWDAECWLVVKWTNSCCWWGGKVITAVCSQKASDCRNIHTSCNEHGFLSPRHTPVILPQLHVLLLSPAEQITFRIHVLDMKVIWHLRGGAAHVATEHEKKKKLWLRHLNTSVRVRTGAWRCQIRLDSLQITRRNKISVCVSSHMQPGSNREGWLRRRWIWCNLDWWHVQY